MLCRLKYYFVLVLIVGLGCIGQLPVGATSGVLASLSHTMACSFQPEPQPAGDSLNQAETNRAFEQVVKSPNEVYGDYNFNLSATNAKQGRIPTVIVKSIAGIESDWEQYTNGVTTFNPDTCDFGIMQVNSEFSPSLFSKNPSLRSDTKGNIAAGSTILKEKWDGVTGSLPGVNNIDPERLTDWYYAIASYNAGPSTNWPNNPNCGRTSLSFVCAGADFRDSRADNVEWSATDPSIFPYQERVLYNLEYQKKPFAVNPPDSNWLTGILGLKSITSLGDYGIRPDDSLFLTPNGDGTYRSAAPNLILFRHRAGPANRSLSRQWLSFEYNLPKDARITIELLDSATTGNVVATLVSDQQRRVGWNMDRVSVTRFISINNAYRITAESGTPGTSSYYIGRYIQKLTTFFAANRSQVRLPIVLKPGTSDLLRNGDFTIADPNSNLQADYWDLQSMLGRNDRSVLDSTSRLTTPYPRIRFLASPGGREELSQSFYISTPGTYRFTYGALISFIQQNKTFLQIRYRATSNLGWTSLKTFTLQDIGVNSYFSHDIFMSSSGTISFLAVFDDEDSQSQFSVDSVSLVRIQ
jgi:hypothetical protein